MKLKQQREDVKWLKRWWPGKQGRHYQIADRYQRMILWAEAVLAYPVNYADTKRMQERVIKDAELKK